MIFYFVVSLITLAILCAAIALLPIDIIEQLGVWRISHVGCALLADGYCRCCRICASVCNW